jgi:hypothetical protein
MPCRAHAALYRGLDKSVSERHGRARHGHSMACVNQTGPHCVNQMGKAQPKPLAARHGRGTAWAQHGTGTAWKRHGMCELTLLETAVILFVVFLFRVQYTACDRFLEQNIQRRSSVKGPQRLQESRCWAVKGEYVRAAFLKLFSSGDHFY